MAKVNAGPPSKAPFQRVNHPSIVNVYGPETHEKLLLYPKNRTLNRYIIYRTV
jgi:hypothetical protein